MIGLPWSFSMMGICDLNGKNLLVQDAGDTSGT